MPHGRHIYAKASDRVDDTLCAYTQSEHAIPHWKYILRCCAGCPHINIPDQEKNEKNEEITPSIRFHIYHIIARCTAHGRIPLKNKKYITCVNKNLHRVSLQKYTPEQNSL